MSREYKTVVRKDKIEELRQAIRRAKGEGRVEDEGGATLERIVYNVEDVKSIFFEIKKYGFDMKNDGLLHLAAAFGDGATVDFFIEQGFSIMAKDQDNATPLHYAAQCNCSGVVAKLLALGADVKAKSLAGFTPLHMAAHAGAKDAIAPLIFSGGADVNAQDFEGLTPLDHVQEGMAHITERLREAGAKTKSEIMASVALTSQSLSSTVIPSASGSGKLASVRAKSR